jgi:hypothetical protein
MWKMSAVKSVFTQSVGGERLFVCKIKVPLNEDYAKLHPDTVYLMKLIIHQLQGEALVQSLFKVNSPIFIWILLCPCTLEFYAASCCVPFIEDAHMIGLRTVQSIQRGQ